MVNAADIKRGKVIMVLGHREVITETQYNNNGTITYWSKPCNEAGVETGSGRGTVTTVDNPNASSITRRGF